MDYVVYTLLNNSKPLIGLVKQSSVSVLRGIRNPSECNTSLAFWLGVDADPVETFAPQMRDGVYVGFAGIR